MHPCSRGLRAGSIAVLAGAAIAGAQADIFANQPPPQGGGVMRWSKLWIDPTGQNNLDGDAICYQDFTLSGASLINHIEWWGDGPPDLGFQIEFWKQDPGTTAYQPYAVFREQGAQPEFAITTTAYTVSGDPTGTSHYQFDFSAPVSLAANDAANPRWFAAVIGRTDVPYLEWNWSQGVGGSNRSYQFIRGGSPAGGDWFTPLPEGRSLLLSGSAVPEPATLGALGVGVLAVLRRRRTSNKPAART
ncbi:MAG: PEP-CTERM sorting domain-containing protein [Fimbriimonadales bacterium]